MVSPILIRLLDHNLHATRSLLNICTDLDAEDYEREFAIGVGSLRKTLVHVIACMQRWVDRISDRELGSTVEAEGGGDNGALSGEPAALLRLLIAADERLRLLAGRLETESRLEEIMTFKSGESGVTFRFTRAVALVHLLTHGVHHRAQALNMLRQLGLDETEIPDLDAIDAELALNSEA